jgi:hypothetical protein
VLAIWRSPISCSCASALIETIYDQLKNVCQIEHPRHRSPLNFLVNLVAGLIARGFSPMVARQQETALPRAASAI